MAGVTALWHLKRKPQNPIVHQTGSLTLLFLLERRADVHGSTRVEALTPLWMPRVTPRFMSALEKNPEYQASTPDEDLGPSSDCRGIPRDPSRLEWRQDLPEAPRAGP